MKRRWITPAAFIILAAVVIVSCWTEWREESRQRQWLRDAVEATSAVVIIRELNPNSTNRPAVLALSGAHHREFAGIVRDLRVILDPARRVHAGHVLVYSNATHQLEIRMSPEQWGTITVSTPRESRQITVDCSGEIRDFFRSFGFQ